MGLIRSIRNKIKGIDVSQSLWLNSFLNPVLICESSFLVWFLRANLLQLLTHGLVIPCFSWDPSFILTGVVCGPDTNKMSLLTEFKWSV